MVAEEGNTTKLGRLVARFNEGDEEAIMALVVWAYKFQLDQEVKRMLNGFPDVKRLWAPHDVQNDVAIKLKTYLDKLYNSHEPLKGSFRGLVGKITYHHLCRLAEGENRRHHASLDAGVESSPLAVKVSPSRPLKRAELREIIESVSPRKRDVAKLHWGESLTVPEVAEAVGIPLGTAKTRLSRASEFLRNLLKNKGYDGVTS